MSLQCTRFGCSVFPDTNKRVPPLIPDLSPPNHVAKCILVIFLMASGPVFQAVTIRLLDRPIPGRGYGVRLLSRKDSEPLPRVIQAVICLESMVMVAESDVGGISHVYTSPFSPVYWIVTTSPVLAVSWS